MRKILKYSIYGIVYGLNQFLCFLWTFRPMGISFRECVEIWDSNWDDNDDDHNYVY